MKTVKRAGRYVLEKLYDIFLPKYICPICNFRGRFADYDSEAGRRKHAQCPKCRAMERHRLQYLVLLQVVENAKTMDVLHFAPEKCFRDIFKNMFKSYLTADLNRSDVDMREDLTNLSFDSESFDLIFASHVFQYIKNDLRALGEIRRVLRNGGLAILPVPTIGKETIEYACPNPHEEDHIRCPGEDYYERYKKIFASVKVYSSNDFSKKYQTYIYQDRTKFSRQNMPLRPAVKGKKHLDFVPVCYK